MKIIQLTAENIKKLVLVEIHPTSNVVQLTGKNGQGKTSVLDAIWWALTGQRNIQVNPIRDGQENAIIKLDLGELVVARTFTRQEGGGYTTKLKVENHAGATYKEPQKMLDGLLDSISFDPLAFSRMSPKERFEALKKFVPGVDFDAIEVQNKLNYEERQNLNRKSKELRAQAAGILFPDGLPEAKVDEDALVNELSSAASHNADIDTRYANREALKKEIEKDKEELALLQSKCDSLGIKISADLTRINSAPPLPDKKFVDEIKDKINKAKHTNAMIDQKNNKIKIEAEALGIEAKSELLTKSMETREADKKKKIEEAKLPVPGVTFGAGIVLLNGQPFEQASDAEQLRAGMAMAMANAPELKVIRVRDGSLLDSDSMKIVEEMAVQHDFQVWIERVGSGDVGFELEEGKIKQ